MKSYRASATINASPETIWSILTDAAQYPQFDPGILRVEGKIAPGEKVTVYTKLSPDRAFPVTVTAFEPNKRMIWSSGMPLGLFKGVRTYLLTPKADGVTEFSTEEIFSGLLLPIIGRSIPDLTAHFESFANGLKAWAEKK